MDDLIAEMQSKGGKAMRVISLSGKAKSVFRFIELMAKAHPDRTLADIK